MNRRVVVFLVVAAFVVSTTATVLPPGARAAAAQAPATEPSVEGSPVVTTPRTRGAEDAVRPQRIRREPVWPSAGTTEVELPATSGVRRIAAETLDPQDVSRLGGIGLGVRVRRADGGAEAATVPVTLDYSGFADAYGAGFTGRLRVVRLPACVVQAHKGECPLSPEVVPARHDTANQRFLAEVPAAADAGDVYLLAAATGGSYGGNFGATDLMASGAWQVGGNAGVFSYSYPVPEPPSPAGNGPDLSFGYNSAAVDGMTSATNGQSGWTGLGWNLGPGFVERRYKPCANDATGSGKRGDQRNWGHVCWESPDENDGQADTTDPTNSELLVSLEGRSTRIVKDRLTGAYKTEDESGWTIQYLTSGAPSGQPYWLITTQGGSVYRFGYRRDSMWQVPYAGDDPGEPCRDRYLSGGSTYPGMCQGPWRWNLDQIVDANENLTTLQWKREAWKYRWYASESCCTVPPSYTYTTIDYDRGGYLDYVEWGANTAVTGSRPTSKLVFNLVSRCNNTTSRDDPHANPYPIDTGTGNLSCLLGTWDVPDDLVKCDTYQCNATGPAFYLMRRLDSIVSYAYDPVSATWQDVHKLQLRFKYIQSPANGQEGCCTPALWLDYIRPVGLAGAGEVRLPPVDFDAVELNGRVDYGPSWWFTKPKAILPRIATVHNGLGGRLEVTYGRPNACPDGGTNGSGYSTWLSSMQWDRAEKDCFQVYDFWFPFGGGPEVFHGIYHKYVVTKVVEKDVVAASPDVVTAYEYQGTPAWAKPLDYLGTTITVTAPGGQQTIQTSTWSEARGYQTVRTLTGSGTDPAGYTAETATYFRGMYDDVYASGTAKQARLNDFDGTAVDDRRWLAGHELQDRTWRMTAYHTDAAQRQYAEIESERHEYQLVITGDGPGVLDPSRVNRVRARARAVRHDGTWRYTDTRIAYDGNGMPLRHNDFGEDGVATDNSCTTTTYTAVVLPAATEERAGDDCAAGALIGRTTNTYDADGNVTETRTWTSATASSTARKTYDDYGRQLTYTDELGRVTTTAYNPAMNWPYNGVTVTGPTGYRTTTHTSLLHGNTVKVTDVDNNRITEVDYDQLGRTTAVWNPGQPRSGTIPSQKFAYAIVYDGIIGQPTVASRSTSDQLLSGSGTGAVWLTSHGFDDGWGRTRESQAPAPGGGRVVSQTNYDSRGLSSAESVPVHNSAAPGSGLLNAAPASLPSWFKHTYDGAEREAATAQHAQSTELRRTTIDYFGAEGHSVIPPAGGSTEYWTDSHGRTVRVVEWAYWGVPYETRFEYDLDSNLTKIIDARGNVRSYTYDWAGRRLTASDPDTGLTTYTYDAGGNLLTTVNAKGEKLSYVYDALDRQTEVWAGDAGTGTRLSSSTHDTVVKGQPASFTSYSGGNAYTNEVLAYDADLRPTRTRVTLPAAEGLLAGAYEFTAAFDKAGHQIETGLPAVPAAGLAAETVTATYNNLGYPQTLTSNHTGGFTYVSGTAYSNTGKLTERRYGAGGAVKRNLTWDPATDRLTNVATWVGTHKKQDDDFFYDAADNITRIVDKTQAVPQTECFNVDLRNRLRWAWTTTKADCSAGWYNSPDGLGTDPYWRGYDYDSAGNMIFQDTQGFQGDYGYAPGTNRLTGIRWPNREDTYSYDATGNLISRTVNGQTTTLSWDPFGRLASATTGGHTTSNVYGPDGTRLIRREPGRTTAYLGPVELELTGSTVAARSYYTHGDGTIVAVRKAGNVSWLFDDHQGSSQLSVDAATNTLVRQRYLPFGARRGGRDDITATQRGYLGKIEDDTTGLVATDNRFYDPVIAKFISADPLIDLRMPEWANPYAYAGNNPVSRMDPSGLASCSNPTQCDHMEKLAKEKAKAKKKKKPKPKPKPKARKCHSDASCSYYGKPVGRAKHQSDLKKCGGTIRACQHKDDIRYLKKVCYNKASCENYERKWVKPKAPKASCGDKCGKDSKCLADKNCPSADPAKKEPPKRKTVYCTGGHGYYGKTPACAEYKPPPPDNIDSFGRLRGCLFVCADVTDYDQDSGVVVDGGVGYGWKKPDKTPKAGLMGSATVGGYSAFGKDRNTNSYVCAFRGFGGCLHFGQRHDGKLWWGAEFGIGYGFSGKANWDF
ncbi:MAG TPA: RHS repeat-associated core domain-containing protein [Candidatus Limnocylindrales bacterium]